MNILRVDIDQWPPEVPNINDLEFSAEVVEKLSTGSREVLSEVGTQTARLLVQIYDDYSSPIDAALSLGRKEPIASFPSVTARPFYEAIRNEVGRLRGGQPTSIGAAMRWRERLTQ